MVCNNCQSELKETDRFCGICGTPNPDYMKSESDTPLSASDGNTRDTLTSDGGWDSNASVQKEKKTAPLWLCILCIIIIFVLSAACGALAHLHFGEAAMIEFFRRIFLW